ncbi:PRTRC system ParB family protein [Novosphingobium sp. NDB2Meth1]|uniref:PRTRC system ParB family protein n=1 Tax=Novosphingobium sp. NDB2Meth1 TaxID=1892847 RepID=UPI00092FF7AE|nr:PRTRC system ParB family protein [Novosphingobium sp. NDB2Meth1]
MTTITEQQRKIPLAAIKPGANPRRYFNPERHAELVASIRRNGVLQPILVRPNEGADAFSGESFELVAGGRRFRAAEEAFGADGLIPAIIRTMTDQEALEAAIDENDVREDASETEQADAALRILAACQDDRAEAARRLGWSTFKLDRRLALAGLSDAVKSALDERRIKVGHAELLAAVPADKQNTALQTILTSGIDVAKTRELLQRVTQNLAAATFDKTECAGCGYNSARQRALFETHVDDGHCTNGACFALKVEAAEKDRAAAEPVIEQDPGDAGGETGSAAVSGAVSSSMPDSPPAPQPEQAGAPAAPAKPAAPAAPAKLKVTAEGLRTKLKPTREQAWRKAVAAAIAESADHVRIADFAAECVASGLHVSFDQVSDLARDLDVDLRTTWRVDGDFLHPLGKDELKFIAEECGLIAHLGTKRFANVLAGKTHEIIASMLHATGFDWAGRIPSCMSLDGKYGAPPAAEEGGEA